MERKVCAAMHWGNPPINKAFQPFPPPHPGMHPGGEHFQPFIGHPLPPPDPYTRTWYGPAPWFDPGQSGTAMPGMHSGLYNPYGPMILGNAYNVGTILTGISTDVKISLVVSFKYSDSSMDQSIEVTTGEVVAMTYLEDAELKTCVGKIVDIWKVYSTDEKTNYYKLKLDCSTDYGSKTVIVKNDQIRGISKYIEHADEDTTLESSTHKYGTTVGVISNARVTNATLDANWNIIEGDIIAGDIDGSTLDGIASGTNSVGTSIMVTNGTTTGGKITAGKILSGVVRSGDVDGTTNPDTNITEKATIQGAVIDGAVIMSSVVTGGKTTGGTFFNAELRDCVVYNARITGSDMTTTGGITEGNITIGGTTVGGTGEGGTATGVIGNKTYTIEGGKVNPEDGKKLVTSGGVVVGGTITGGIRSGNVIIGAVVTGGVATKGMTTNAVVVPGDVGEIVPSVMNPIPIAKMDFQNEDRSALIEDLKAQGPPPGWKTSDDLLIFGDKVTGEMSTNLSTAAIEHVAKLDGNSEVAKILNNKQ